jgi:hypothetical protein
MTELVISEAGTEIEEKMKAFIADIIWEDIRTTDGPDALITSKILAEKIYNKLGMEPLGYITKGHQDYAPGQMKLSEDEAKRRLQVIAHKEMGSFARFYRINGSKVGMMTAWTVIITKMPEK